MKMISKIRAKNLSGLLVLAMISCFLVYAIVANYSLGSSPGTDTQNVSKLLETQRQIGVSQKYLSEAYVVAVQAAYQPDIDKRNMTIKMGINGINGYLELKNIWNQVNLETNLTTKVYKSEKDFIENYQNQFSVAMAEDSIQMRLAGLGSMERIWQGYRASAENAVQGINKLVSQKTSSKESSSGSFAIFSIIIGLIILACGIALIYAEKKNNKMLKSIEVSDSSEKQENKSIEPIITYIETPESKENAEKVANLRILLDAVKDIVTSGNLSRKLDIRSSDEIGQIADYYNATIVKYEGILQGISETTKTIVTFSNDKDNSADSELVIKIKGTAGLLSEIQAKIIEVENRLSGSTTNINEVASSFGAIVSTINGFASTTQQVSSNVTNISDSASAISSSINNLSNSSKEVTNSVNTVTGAVKEINVSLNDISKNCERSIQITADAGRKATDTNTIMNKLGTSSKQIEKIINVINDIADQTNMLALNAAIEAAGAGEAGKGFAVVANEVKELAKQTAEATDEISQQIENMQTNMSDAVDAMSTINDVIKEITTITNTIAAAVTEQSATTGEILNSVLRASDRVGNITKEISEIAVNSNASAKNILETSKGLQDMVRSSAGLANSAIESAMNIETVKMEISNITNLCETVVGTSVQAGTEIDQISNNSAKLISKNDEDMGELIRNVSALAKKLDMAELSH